MAIYFVYRLSFVLWRVRSLLGFFVIYFLWSAIYSNRGVVFGYTQEKMITYIFLVGLIDSVAISSRTADLAGDIVNGNIINHLLKPISVFSIIGMREFVDKLVNGSFALIEIVLFILILHPRFFFQTNISVYPFIALAVLLGTLIAFFMSLSLSLIAFWTSEIWAPRFIYFILISMLAGTAFPLDILPSKIYNLLLLTPFPYFVYLPAKIYLQGVTVETIPSFIMAGVWCVILFFVAKITWNRGIRQFSFFGK